MADLYGAASSPNHEPEEISTFLNQLLHNPSSSCMHFKAKHIHSFSSPALGSLSPAAVSGSGTEVLAEDRYGLSGSGARFELETRVRDRSSSVNFSDPEAYFGADVKDSAGNALSSAGEYSCDSVKAVEALEAEDPSNPERPRSSSKRSRAAEVHNMSEKRRRSRINEKMKALQNLIPNSNKTDKASMLDEAIDYLKQLQLQVQMLSMRNGLSLYPMCLPTGLQHSHLPTTDVGYDEGNGFFSPNAGTGTLSANIHAPFDLSNQCAISNQPAVAHSVANSINLEASFDFAASTQAHYGSFSPSSSSKELYKEGTAQLQLEMNHTGKKTSSSVS